MTASLALTLVYRSRCFGASTVQRMLGETTKSAVARSAEAYGYASLAHSRLCLIRSSRD
ncbi:MAG: hypothetical protein J5990_07600 [Bacteroidales bacterium]|nr:hypothetical protein [Bacteroidales bacterium]